MTKTRQKNKLAKKRSVEELALGRKIIYPYVYTEICGSPPKGVKLPPHIEYSDPISVDKAKDILGWITDPEEAAKHGLTDDDAICTILEGEEKKKVWCLNNDHNRPFTESWAKTLSQDVLNRNWADSRNSLEGERRTLNGETIIIGRTGLVLSAQHRLFGLVLAYIDWKFGRNKDHWQKKWEEEPSIEGIIVYGIDESSKTTRTLDNVKPRSFGDVLYADEDNIKMFGKVNTSQWRIICRTADFAVKFLWKRTGAVNNPFSPKRTHSESKNFLEKHKRLLKAVKHIIDINVPMEGGRATVARYVPIGTAAGLLYLMAVSESNGDRYWDEGKVGNARESILDFTNWEKACEFWTGLASHGKDTDTRFKGVRDALGALADANTLADGSVEEKTAIIVRAWNLFIHNMKMKEEELSLEDLYERDEDTGVKWLAHIPKLYGIDLGDPNEKEDEKDKDKEDEDDDGDTGYNPDEEDEDDDEADEDEDEDTDDEEAEDDSEEEAEEEDEPVRKRGKGKTRKRKKVK
jgi:hypothetical protein